MKFSTYPLFCKCWRSFRLSTWHFETKNRIANGKSAGLLSTRTYDLLLNIMILNQYLAGFGRFCRSKNNFTHNLLFLQLNIGMPLGIAVRSLHRWFAMQFWQWNEVFCGIQYLRRIAHLNGNSSSTPKLPHSKPIQWSRLKSEKDPEAV